MPTVSVITVVWNDLEGLVRTCQSVKAQDSIDFEWLVIDGDSKDGCYEWLQSQPESSCRWVSEADGGIYDAMNKGVRLATGDLVVFMNAGDAFSSTSTLTTVIESWRSERWYVCFGAVRYVDEDGREIEQFWPKKFNWAKLATGSTYVPHQTVYVARELFMELEGFDEQHGLSADQVFFLRASRWNTPKQFDMILADFQGGGRHTSSGMFERAFRYRGARRDLGARVLNSSIADLAVTLSYGLNWSSRNFVKTRLLRRRLI